MTAARTAAREFALPDLGEGLTEAEIVQWLVEVGEVVAVDQPIVAVETAKALVEVPCPYGGVVTARFGAEGEEIPVGSVLVTVVQEATLPSDEGRGAGAADHRAVEASPVSGPADTGEEGRGSEGSGQVLVGYGTQEGVRRRRRPARHTVTSQAVDAPERASGADSPTPPSGTSPLPRSGSTAVISPLVRRLAREHRIDLRTVRGSGPDGLILRADVERSVASAARTAPPTDAPLPAEAGSHRAGPAQGPLPGDQSGRAFGLPGQRRTPEDTATSPRAAGDPTDAGRQDVGSVEGVAGERRIPLRGLRGRIADKLSRSRQEIPEATCWVDADATELLAVRAAMSAPPRYPASARPQTGGAGGTTDEPVVKVPLLAILARICTAALARYPGLNASVDTDAREIVQHSEVHLGLAAQTDRGLVVPVVRDAGRHTIDRLSQEVVRLTEAARAGSLAPGELVGGTFTLNNYGVLGVDGSTPIINHPEAAMLGVGRIVPKPWVWEGELAVRHVVQLSLTFDHRVCDGGTAGGFLRYVADCVEQPAVLLRGL